MRKGDQAKLIGKHPYIGGDGTVNYSWEKVYRHVTQEEVEAWYDSPESKGMNSAGESKLPPRIAVVCYDGGTLSQIDWHQSGDNVKLSNDTFTIVRSRCAPILGYHKCSKMALIRNNRTGEEGYIQRAYVQTV